MVVELLHKGEHLAGRVYVVNVDRVRRNADDLARLGGQTGGLKALVAIEVSFEAVEGGGMEHVEAVSNVRAATAEFLYDGSRWRTDGRVYFNLAPTATVKYLAADLELVAEEHAVRA